MTHFLIVTIGGAGGDLQPLVAAALAIRDRGHQIAFIGDRSVGRALSPLGVDVHVLPSELDLGPRFAGAIRGAMAATGGDIQAAGPIVEQRMAEWASQAAQPIGRAIVERRPDAVVTSLFGVEVVQRAEPRCPWAVINSTFYLGPNPPRPIEEDVGVRAIPHECDALQDILNDDERLAAGYELLQRFRRLINRRSVRDLIQWLADAAEVDSARS